MYIIKIEGSLYVNLNYSSAYTISCFLFPSKGRAGRLAEEVAAGAMHPRRPRDIPVIVVRCRAKLD
jgi:hypothetical protein